ncbi:SpoIIE family protein phosphatase [Nonomuraea sp. NPDC050643]|uniref:SpoIIE family protein phosphatase n=1 Tax=Nonomuraea sp. NPDC050643 TaxID=3155660 RepID=UPI0033F43B63
MIYLLADDPDVLLMETEIGLPGHIVRPWSRLRMAADAPMTAAVRRRRLIWVPDHQDLARRFPGTALALPYSFATAAVPLHTGSHLWGGWVLLWPTPRAPELSPCELKIINATSHDLATLLRRAADGGHPLRCTGEPRVLTPAQTPPVDPGDAAARYLDRLHDGCVALDLDGVITFASATAAGLLGAGGAELRGRMLWEVAAWLADPVFEDGWRAAVIGRRATSCTVRDPDGRELVLRLDPDPTGVSLRITPLAPVTPVTSVTIDRPEFSAGPPRADVVHNFLHMAAALTRTLNVREVVDVITAHVMPVFGAQALAILIAEGGKMRIAGSYGYRPDALDRLGGLPVASPTPAEHVLGTGAPLFFTDGDELRQRFPRAGHDDGMAAWAFLPLTVSDDTVGTCVLAFDRPHPFPDDQRATLTALAGLMGQALDRALLYDTKDRLAHSLQTTLLPRTLPEIPGLEVAARYVPATRGVGVGGDFYDLIRLNDTTAAAVIGDVQGHNMTAAALMGQVRTAIHAHTVAGASPGDVLKHTNRLLIDLDTDLFTSCLLIHFDLQLRTLRAANAGHPPPLLRPPSMPAEVIDVPPGVVLGIDPDADYPTIEAPFPPGAVVALYTDGLVETRGIDLDDAIDDLAAHLTCAGEGHPQRLTGLLLDQAAHTRDNADDVALLVLQHGSGPHPAAERAGSRSVRRPA